MEKLSVIFSLPARHSNSPAIAISGGYSTNFLGNLTGNGKISINTRKRCYLPVPSPARWHYPHLLQPIIQDQHQQEEL